MPAPQAEALAGIIEGLKTGNIPTAKYLMGGTIGVLLSATPIAGLGVAIGLAMYLPFKVSLVYGIGCFIRMFIQKIKGDGFCKHKLMPLVTGLMVGAALFGLGDAVYRVLTSNLGGI